jgi:hypothetical protein
MRSQKTWGKSVDDLLNERGVACPQSCTGCVHDLSFEAQLGGKVRFVRLLSDGFPRFSSHPKTGFYSLLFDMFSTLSTPPITIRTN